LKTQSGRITVFEHQSIKLNQIIDDVVFDLPRLEALRDYFGHKGVPYFSLISNGVRFNEFVGVIQVGQTVYEVLPKADNVFSPDGEKNQWRDMLVDMLFAVRVFDVRAPSSSSLKLKSNSILDLYFELLINEVEYLLHNGLFKKYRSKEGNVTALKGSLQFGKHIQHNLTHQERFYTKFTTYDLEHQMHFILYKAIGLLKQINTNADLHSRIGSLLLHFPEMPDIKVTKDVFDKIIFTRKNQSYKMAFEISKLLLLKYHPDVSNGKNHVLAIMFDMNKLWEQFVFCSLTKHKEKNVGISAQTTKLFWKSQRGSYSKMRPDIVIKDNDQCVVLDTKWKNLNGFNPSPDDLRQMYVYSEYYQAKKIALVYPAKDSLISPGIFLDPITGKENDKECSVISISVDSKIQQWQKNIYNNFKQWLNLSI
jgi:5-methylcytosine-specific restriction enzyme subunit McrC